MYRENIGWASSKLITRIISLDLRSSEPQHRQYSPMGTPPKFGWNKGGDALLSRKPAISLKRGKIRPRLLLMTNRKSHTRFRLVSKLTTLGDLEGYYALCSKHTRLSEPSTKIWMKINLYFQRRRCSPITLVSGNIRFMRIFAGVPWRGGVKRQWGSRKHGFSGLSDATSSAPSPPQPLRV